MGITSAISTIFSRSVRPIAVMASSASQPTRAAQRSSYSTDERRWNKLGSTMLHVHNMFKQQYNMLYNLADGSFHKEGLSLGLYLQRATMFSRQLTNHHTLEEEYFFPQLARRMPAFKEDQPDGIHINSHGQIHHGLESLDSLVHKWKEDPSTYSPTEMRDCLDSFREVLFRHLDQEVEDLKGENMKKYFTLDELDELML